MQSEKHIGTGQGVKVSESESMDICSLYLAGKTLPYLAKTFSRSKGTISAIINRKGISRNNKSLRSSLKTRNIISNKDTVVKIFNDYKSGKSGNKIAKDLNVSSWIIYNILSSNDTPQKIADKHRPYDIDHYCFNNIDSCEKAYWLGFIAADGHVSDRYVKISLAIKDLSHIEKFKSFIGSNVPIKEYSVNGHKCCSIIVYSNQMVKNLREMGFAKNKTFRLSIPDISCDLYSSYILGVFDGDGSFAGSTEKFSITGCRGHLLEIQDTLMKSCSLNKTKLYNAKGCFVLEYSGKNQVKRIVNYLYSNDNTYLKRKRDIAEGYCAK